MDFKAQAKFIRLSNEAWAKKVAADIPEAERFIRLEKLSKEMTTKRESKICYCKELHEDFELRSDLRLRDNWKIILLKFKEQEICAVCFDLSGYDGDFVRKSWIEEKMYGVL